MKLDCVIMTNYCVAPNCNEISNLICSGCRTVNYCGRVHQTEDWKSHKKNCKPLKPYDVKRNDKLGRYMVATRDLKAGEILFQEFPVSAGPKMNCNSMCLGCHKILSQNNVKALNYKCSKCFWPLCGPYCENLMAHVEECNLMVSKNIKCYDSTPPYYLILPMRVLLMKKSNPKVFEKILMLESHVEHRINTHTYDVMKKRLVPYIQSLLGASDYPELLILTVAGILDTNCFEILLMSQQMELGGLFLTSLILCHDCIPNTRHYVNFISNVSECQRFQMTFETTVPVKKGEMLTTSYTSTLKPTMERRLHLKQTKIFDCDCKRCADATEFETHGSSFKCQKCKGGLVISNESLNRDSYWSCMKCQHKIQAVEINTILLRLQHQMDNLNRTSPLECEELLKQMSKFVADSNLLVIEIKYNLSMLYGNVNGFQYKDHSEEMIVKKLQLCNDVLKVYDVLDPGRTILRSNVVFELNCAKIMKAKFDILRKLISKADFDLLVADSMEKLKEAKDVILTEEANKNIMDFRMKKITAELN